MEDFRETCEDFMGWLAQLATRRGKKMLFMGVEVTLDPKQRRTEDYGMVQSIRTQFAGEDAPMSLLKRDLLGSKDGEMSQGDRFRSIGSDEWIHELLPVHKE